MEWEDICDWTFLNHGALIENSSQTQTYSNKQNSSTINTIESEEKKDDVETFVTRSPSKSMQISLKVIIDYKILCKFAFRVRNTAFIIRIIFHWIISPPCEYSKLSKIARHHSTTNKMTELHLCSMDGQSSFEKVNKCVRKITREGDIYVDGDHGERRYIKKIIGRNIISSEKTKISFCKSLRINNEVSLCGLHSARGEKETNWALQRALLTRAWFLSLATVELIHPEILNMLVRGKGTISNKEKFICYDELNCVGVKNC